MATFCDFKSIESISNDGLKALVKYEWGNYDDGYQSTNPYFNEHTSIEWKTLEEIYAMDNKYGIEAALTCALPPTSTTSKPSPKHRLTTSTKATILKEQTKTKSQGDKFMPKLDSVPAVNKEGFSRVTFWGLEDGCKEYEVTDKETGEITKAKREYTKLKFTILDKTKVSPLTANVVGQSLNTRELWATVLGLGYKPEETPDTLDDGDDTLDDEPVETANELDSIVNFLKCVEGKHFICKVERDKRGYWTLKPETLAPFVPVAK